MTTEEHRTRKRANKTGLPPEAHERLTKAVRTIMERYDSDIAQSATARAIGFSPPAINRLLQGHGGSVKMVRAVAKVLNESPSRILFGEEDQAPIRRLRELPGFAEAMPEAKRRAVQAHHGLTAAELEAAADTKSIPEPAYVTADLLIHIALSHKPPPAGASGSKATRRTR